MKQFHTGGFGTAYQGHAAGTEESINDHEINVYAKSIDVLKRDAVNQSLPGAVFTLYKAAAEQDGGAELPAEYGLEGTYVALASGTSNSQGIAELKNDGNVVQLLKGETYYLVETDVPAGYQRDTGYRVVTVEIAEDGVFTDLENQQLAEKVYPFNWAQGVKILVDGEAAIATDSVLVNGYTKLSEEVLFRTKVINDTKSTELQVTKNWKDKTGKNTAKNGDTVSFQVTRQIGDEGEPEVVTLTDDNLISADGVARNGNTITLTYNNGWPTARVIKLPYYVAGSTTQKYTYSVLETAHTPSDKEVTVSYIRTAQDDQHISVTMENTDVEEPVDISVKKKWLDANGDEWQNPDLNSIDFTLYKVHYVPCEHEWQTEEHAATCTEDGYCRRECSKCGEKEEITYKKTGHAWGEWEIIDPASYNHEGTKKRVCKNDPSHVETESYTIEDHVCVPGEWITTTAATCDTPGEETQYCTICLKPLNTRAVPAMEHDWAVSDVQPATCLAEGHVHYVCRNDSSHTKTETVEKLEHIWGDTWETTKEATTEEEGEETRYCLRGCGESQTRPIDKLPSTVKVTIYMDKQKDGNYYYLGTPEVRDVKVGSTVHVEFTGYAPQASVFYYPDVYYRLNSMVTYNNYQGCYELQGVEKRMGVTTYTNAVDYYMDIVVTEDTRIDICLPNSWYSPRPFYSVTVTEPAAASNHAPARKQTLAVRAMNLFSGSPSRLTAPLAANQVPEVLRGIDGTVIPVAEADGRDNVYIYEVVGTYTITSQDQWTWTRDNLERSDENGYVYTYYVMETNPSSGYEITYTGQEAGIHDGETATINNKVLKGSLLITKNVLYNGKQAQTEEEKAKVNGTYSFIVKKNGAEIEGNPFNISVQNGVSASVLIENLDQGDDYTIEEISSGALTFKEATGGTAVNGNTVTATVTAGKLTEADLLSTGKAAFTNNYIAYEVIIEKVDTGDTTIKLGNAKFDLYSEESVEDGKIKDGALPLRSNLISSSDEADKGKVSLGHLEVGTYYLFETEPPAGYVIMDMPVTIIVSENHIGLTQGSRVQTGTIKNGKSELMVMNSSGASLPSTGGPGTTLLYLLGIMLTVFAGACLVMRRRMRDAA